MRRSTTDSTVNAARPRIRLKETQLDLFGARASCQRFKANPFRMLLAALAYTLMQALKRHALAGTVLARATSATIRCRLLKIGCAIVKNTRRSVLMLASAHALRESFELAAPLTQSADYFRRACEICGLASLAVIRKKINKLSES